jgi:hypothetical protein
MGAEAYLTAVAGILAAFRTGGTAIEGWGIVFGVVTLAGPIGFFGVPGAALWIILESIVLTMRV